MDGYQQMARVMKAMGHPIRLQILDALSREEEACVCHLEHQLGQRQAYISQQLARLRDAGLVVDQKDGLNVYYSLTEGSIDRILDVTKETMFAIAQNEGREINFNQPIVDPPTSCPCPRCHEFVETKKATRQGV